ncbi:right-handed parallel beta-helix repeat-containing protein [Paenibacillus sp. GD4]|jgi:hypothetical protein|uniref:right-handed parallel beta-helix repeat-containing protein n=1 Tax=Paenibacillus sp. GD4 TaxID=3068890 RepID=UPI0027968AEA|nr:right-handed parallel beta-helix repeat-containing protein [Paenibacillus sp. GD4]MDQ1912681.1 right-handed parallel beta-helix repeat-containing protein [Paenibacillus sp. GD4]
MFSRSRKLSLHASLAMVVAASTVGISLTEGVNVVNASSGITYYVSTTGSDDTGTGTLEAPFRTPHKARDVVRQQIAGGMNEDITVMLRGGTYHLESTLAFNELDSGRDGHRITYRSYPGESAVLDASKPITGWQLYNGNIYKANVGTSWSFDVLFENQVQAMKARYPNIQGDTNVYHRVEAIVAGDDRKSFVFAQSDIPSVTNPTTLETYIWPGGAQGYQYWYSYTVGVSAINYANRTVTLTKPVGYVIGPGSRYFMQGALELLDQPGEFFLDRSTGTVYYYPHDTAQLIGGISAPFAGEAVRLTGSSTSAPVTDITLEGLTIRNTNVGKDGIHGENLERVHVLNSRIYNTGEHGIQLLGWAKSNRIEGNEIQNIGYNGVSIEGLAKTAQHVSSGNIVTNNHVHHVGKFYGNSGGVRIYDSGENIVSHNRIHHSPRYAIHIKAQRKGYLVGTTIENVLVTENNYRDYQHARNNLVEYNDVSNATTDSQDAGIIAGWGTGTGNIVRYNLVHDSDLQLLTEVPSRSFGYGLYFDDNSDDVLLQGNIVHSLQQTGGGYLNSSVMLKGIGIRLDNNIIAGNREQNGTIGSTQTGGEISSELEITRNILYQNDAKLYSINYWDENKFTHADHNVYYTTKGTYEFGGSIPAPHYDRWLELQLGKFDQHSIVAEDPRFMNAAEHDYRLRYDSPAYKLGMIDLDRQSMGLKGDYPYADPNDPLAVLFVKKAGESTNKAWTVLEPSQSAKLKVSGRTAQGYFIKPAHSSISFASSHPSVATVSSSGVVQAIGSGAATITISATHNGVTKTTSFDVLVNDSLASVGIHFPDSMQVGASVHADVYGVSALGRYVDVTGASVQYASSSPTVAAVDSNGQVTGTGTGTAVLSAQVTVAGNVYTVSKPIEVYVTSTELETYDFEGSGIGGWVSLSGTWQIAEDGDNHAYQNTNTANTARSYLGHIIRSDYSLKARMKADAWGTGNPVRLGLIGRYVNSTNFYYAAYEQTTQRFKLFKIVNGTVSTIASSAVMPTDFTAGYREMKLDLVGTSLRLYLDGNEVLSAQDFSFSEGYPGLYAYNQKTYFDDIVVEDISGS